MPAQFIPPQATRQPTATRSARTPAAGEIVFDTGLGLLFLGDGTTLGGADLRPAVWTITSNYTALATDEILLANAAAGPLTITLPSAAGLIRKRYIVKRIDSAPSAVTLAATSPQTIDGQANIQLQTRDCLWVISDGSHWWLL